MTVPKLVTNPPQGSGLISSLVDEHYEDLVRGKPGQLIAAAVLLQPVGTAQRRTKDGLHKTVTYEIVKLEPMRDPHDADDMAWRAQHAYERRTAPAQMTLTLNSPAEQRDGILDSIEEWREAEGLTVDDLDARWVEYFGGREHAASETVANGSLLQLMEWGRVIGALVDDGGSSGPDEDQGADEAGGEPEGADDDPEQVGDVEEPAAAVPTPGFSEPAPVQPATKRGRT